MAELPTNSNLKLAAFTCVQGFKNYVHVHERAPAMHLRH